MPTSRISLDAAHGTRDVDHQTLFTVSDLVCQCSADPVGAQGVDLKHPCPLCIVNVTEGLSLAAVNTGIIDQEVDRLF